jgi:hypothetical protein
MIKWLALIILLTCASSFAYAQKMNSYSKGILSTIPEGTVVATGQGGVPSVILMEDGTKILMEDGVSHILTEP